MPRFTIPQRIWVCIEFACVGNAHEVLRRWRNHWLNTIPPTIRTILKTFEKFGNEETCHNLNKQRSGRPRTARSIANIARVRNALQRDGKRSSRRNGLNLSASSFLRITKEIKFHPYVLVARQKQEPVDPLGGWLFATGFFRW